MKLVSNWRVVLRRSWAVRVTLISYALSALADLWPALGDVVPPAWFIGVGLPLAIVARVLDQGLGK